MMKAVRQRAVRRRRRLGAGFSPAALFGASEPGFYAEAVMADLWQDTARTSPVTALGQSVASWALRGASGAIVGYAEQATAASQPLYQLDGNGFPSVLFDGVDDFLLTPTITPGTDIAQIFMALRKASDAALGYPIDTTANITGANNGGVALLAPYAAAAAGYRFTSKGTTAVNTANITGYPAPNSAVLTGLSQVSAPSAVLRVDGVQGTTTTATQGTGNYLAYETRIGRRAGTINAFNGGIHGIVLRFGPALLAEQIAAVERWLAAKNGVTLA